MALIDDVLPDFDVHEVHAIACARSLDEALATTVAADPLVRALLRLCGLRIRGGVTSFAEARPGTVRMVANVVADGRRVSTETRVAAVDEAARRTFGRYWLFVGPFSALIRRRWLKRIAA